ncbi:HAD-IA family hydrolase [Pelomonas sp. P7]|uniref:HAD-IA family hydrolase n=1 Tax=Pelomonas caseinilytica TaxID=2906763 RepID=A0ABS8XCP2_9BURK|nr:HAD-IA family hydrolase [Pelomonas sp. P7]MCE4536995.1 HAD-IA family hydrolase [Pelomonas sp. P7]
MAIEALVFDVDGTLADTEEAHRVAFNLAFERHRLGWSWSRSDYRRLLEVSGGKERIASYIDSLPLPPAERARLRALVPTLHADKTRFYTSAVLDGGVPLREGVARLVHEAVEAGCRLAIASTTTAANIHALLAATLGPRGLDLFAVVACGDQVRAKKPAPDIYRLALATLGLTPERAVALEDSVHGLRAATGAGLWTLVTPTFWTEGGDFTAAGLVLPGLGGPDAPLAGEPGCQLGTAAWLRFEELCELASPPPSLTPLQALYRGLPP